MILLILYIIRDMFETAELTKLVLFFLTCNNITSTLRINQRWVKLYWYET